MQNPRKFHSLVTIGGLFGVASAAVALAACSFGSTPSPALHSAQAHTDAGGRSILALTGPRLEATGCPTSVVYIVSSGNSLVEVYDASQLGAGPCGRVTGLSSPQGLFVDSKRNLWVADAVAQQIYKFTPGTKSPVRTLSDPDGIPFDIVVDETSGTAYVTEYQNNVDSSRLVEVYAKGSTLPTGSLSDPAARNGAYDAVDNQGNLYVTFMTQSNKAQVDRWIGGSGSPQNLGLKLVSAGGIVTTASGALAVCDPFGFRCGSFAPGTTTMSHVFGHMGLGSDGVNPDKPPWLHPDTLALNRSQHLAYVAAGSLSTWKFPGPDNRPNHRPLAEFNIPGGAGRGIAVSPASRPGTPF